MIYCCCFGMRKVKRHKSAVLSSGTGKKHSKFNKKNSVTEGVGGQAVIEGVMMKKGPKIAIAVRKPNKKISVKTETLHGIGERVKFLKWPFIRGTVNLFEQLIFGIKALNYSANEAIGEDEEKITKGEFFWTILFAIVVAVGIFIILPLYLTKVTQTQGILFNVIDGVIRLGLFLLYIFGISFLADVKRLFQYHGAEHMTVHCYEAKKNLTVANVKKYGTAHKRCGTTFLLIVLIVSIFIFSLIISESFWIKLLGRLVLLPVIAGISYELLKLGAKYPKNIILNALSYPGMMVQKMTTRKPDNKQLEVAIKALKAVV